MWVKVAASLSRSSSSPPPRNSPVFPPRLSVLPRCNPLRRQPTPLPSTRRTPGYYTRRGRASVRYYHNTRVLACFLFFIFRVITISRYILIRAMVKSACFQNARGSSVIFLLLHVLFPFFSHANRTRSQLSRNSPPIITRAHYDFALSAGG